MEQTEDAVRLRRRAEKKCSAKKTKMCVKAITYYYIYADMDACC